MIDIDVKNTKYDYFAAVVSDIEEYLAENEIVLRDCDLDGLQNDIMNSDMVTGNASGSYFCNSWNADICLCHNLGLLFQALEEFGYDSLPILQVVDSEWCDVLIRCYLVPSAFAAVVGDTKDALEEYYMNHSC